MNLRRLDQFEFHHVLEATPGVALVLFTAPACGACRRLKQILGGEAALPNVTLFEVDAERDLGLTREFEVFHLPSLFLYLDGQFHCELKSEAHPHRIAEAIRGALAAPPQEAP